MKSLIFTVVLLVSAGLPENLAAQITADMSITEDGVPIGTITLELDHVRAPMATANFIGLATGQFAWIDSTTGQVRQDPYYDGIIFHRVIAGFMNQTGSQKGDGSDGPGYVFPDGNEVNNGLNHDQPYVVSMANSGANSNGSQIFITAAQSSHLNGVHIVFGKASAASESVVDYINNVAVVDNLPVKTIRIESVTVDYNGVVFDIFAQGLPTVSAIPTSFSHTAGLFELNLEQPAASLTKYSHTSNLADWQSGGEVYQDENAQSLDKIDVSTLATGNSQLFFRASRVTYDTTDPLWPGSFAGRVLTIEDSLLADQYTNTWVFTFTSENGGTVVNGAQTGTFTVEHYGSNWLAGWQYLQTDLQYMYNGQNYDVNYFLRMTKNTYSTTHFTGTHSGTMYLTTAGVIQASGPANGTMTLTR